MVHGAGGVGGGAARLLASAGLCGARMTIGRAPVKTARGADTQDRHNASACGCVHMARRSSLRSQIEEVRSDQIRESQSAEAADSGLPAWL
jgi:hypothetical protein